MNKQFKRNDEISYMKFFYISLFLISYNLSLGSPLFVTVQALVNENLGHSNLILNSSALLYLRSIFNAIKRTEDAVDDQITPVSILCLLMDNLLNISHNRYSLRDCQLFCVRVNSNIFMVVLMFAML